MRNIFLETDNSNNPLDWDTILEHLKLSCDDITYDYLYPTIKAIEGFIEKYTSRTLLTKTYKLLADFGEELRTEEYTAFKGILLERSPYVSLTSVKYLDVDGVFQDMSADDYVVNVAKMFSALRIDSAPAYSNEKGDNTLEVVFKAGYGETKDDLPFDLQQAMLLILASWWQYRGDCIGSASISGFDMYSNLPPQAQAILESYKIENFYV